MSPVLIRVTLAVPRKGITRSEMLTRIGCPDTSHWLQGHPYDLLVPPKVVHHFVMRADSKPPYPESEVLRKWEVTLTPADEDDDEAEDGLDTTFKWTPTKETA